MVDYDPHRWFSHLFDIRGSMVREISVRVGGITLWSAAVVWAVGAIAPLYPQYQFYLDPTMHQMVGIALSLMLVLRTNSSYDRFWEGRKLWGGIVNETRNLARGVSVHLAGSPQLRNEIIQWTIAFAFAAMYSLRKKARVKRRGDKLEEDTPAATADKALGPIARAIPQEEADALLRANHLPSAVAIRLTGLLRKARDQGHISDIVLTSLDQNVQLLIDYIGGCERIHTTPIPYAYMVHCRRILLLYCLTLPLALAQQFGWKTVPLTFLLGYILMGIEEIGVEIEDPFGEDENDLPLERFCGTIERNLTSLMSDSQG